MSGLPATTLAVWLWSLVVAGQSPPIFDAGVGGPDCGPLPPLSAILTSPTFAALFRGTVSEVKDAPDGQLVTFRVTRVWKGDVTQEIVVYNQMAWTMVDVQRGGPPFLQRPWWAKTFTVGAEYLIIPDGRIGRSLSAGTTLEGLGATFALMGGAPCLTTLFDSPGVAKLLGDAPGDPPR